MARKKLDRTKNSYSSVGLRMDKELIFKWSQAAHSIPVSKTFMIESALHHFLQLSPEQQKAILKSYITKDL